MLQFHACFSTSPQGGQWPQPYPKRKPAPQPTAPAMTELPGLTKSDRRLAAFVRADAHDFVERNHEYFAVTDLAGLRGRHDGVDRLRGDGARDGDFDFHLRQKIDRVFAATINLGVTLLAAEAFDLGDRHALDADFGERGLNFFEFKGLDDGDDEFHGEAEVSCDARLGFRLVDVAFFAVVAEVQALLLGFDGRTQADQCL